MQPIQRYQIGWGAGSGSYTHHAPDPHPNASNFHHQHNGNTGGGGHHLIYHHQRTPSLLSDSTGGTPLADTPVKAVGVTGFGQALAQAPAHNISINNNFLHTYPQQYQMHQPQQQLMMHQQQQQQQQQPDRSSAPRARLLPNPSRASMLLAFPLPGGSSGSTTPTKQQH